MYDINAMCSSINNVLIQSHGRSMAASLIYPWLVSGDSDYVINNQFWGQVMEYQGPLLTKR